MVNVYEFYRCQKWKKLIALIKMERVKEDGQIYCEFCGEPITKAYDCIGHHEIELTEENVNDANISLNPENIKLVHHRCHNVVHNKLGYAGRNIYLVYGSPLAGKSTWVNNVQSTGDLIVDIDSIWECISGMGRYEKPGRLNAVAFGTRDYLIDTIRTRQGKWKNAYLIGGYPLISERERTCKTLGAKEILIDTSKKECLDRLQQTEDGRDKEEWGKYINDWWAKYAPRAV